MYTMTRRGILAACVSASLAIGALPGPASAQTPVTVVVPNPSAITFMPMWAALGEGYFAEEGLDITVEAVDGSSSVLQVHVVRTGPDRRPRTGAGARGPRPRRRRGVPLQPLPEERLRPDGEGGFRRSSRPRTSRAR